MACVPQDVRRQSQTSADQSGGGAPTGTRGVVLPEGPVGGERGVGHSSRQAGRREGGGGGATWPPTACAEGSPPLCVPSPPPLGLARPWGALSFLPPADDRRCRCSHDRRRAPLPQRSRYIAGRHAAPSPRTIPYNLTPLNAVPAPLPSTTTLPTTRPPHPVFCFSFLLFFHLSVWPSVAARLSRSRHGRPRDGGPDVAGVARPFSPHVDAGGNVP